MRLSGFIIILQSLGRRLLRSVDFKSFRRDLETTAKGSRSAIVAGFTTNSPGEPVHFFCECFCDDAFTRALFRHFVLRSDVSCFVSAIKSIIRVLTDCSTSRVDIVVKKS